MTTTRHTPVADPTAAPPSADPRTAVRQAVVFVGITFAVATALALGLPGTAANPGPVALLTLLTPALVVGLIRLGARLRHGPANPYPLGLRRLGLRSWPAAVALPLLSIGASFAVAAALGIVQFDGLGAYVMNAPFNLVIMTVLLLGEEIGWRGYLLPRVAALLPARRASLLTGLIHGLFHLPLLLLTVSYDGDGSRWLVVPGVVAVISAGGVVFGWLRIRSQSLWPALIAHATVNTCLLEAPVLLSDDPDLTAHLTGEGGLFTLLTVGLVALAVWKLADWTPTAAAGTSPVVIEAAAGSPAVAR